MDDGVADSRAGCRELQATERTVRRRKRSGVGGVASDDVHRQKNRIRLWWHSLLVPRAHAASRRPPQPADPHPEPASHQPPQPRSSDPRVAPPPAAFSTRRRLSPQARLPTPPPTPCRLLVGILFLVVLFVVLCLYLHWACSRYRPRRASSSSSSTVAAPPSRPALDADAIGGLLVMLYRPAEAPPAAEREVEEVARSV